MPYMSEADVGDVIHFFFLLDSSSSMSGASIQALNEAMVNVLPAIQCVGDSSEVAPIVHMLAFNNDVQWLCGTSATNGIEAKDIVWNNISADGGTDTAGAINAILEGLSHRHLGYHSYRPVIVLITDGYSDDANATAAAVDALVKCWKSVRVAVGVNGYNPSELDGFASAANVTIVDDLGNEVSVKKQKLIFPVDHADWLADVIRSIFGGPVPDTLDEYFAFETNNNFSDREDVFDVIILGWETNNIFPSSKEVFDVEVPRIEEDENSLGWL